MANFAVIIGINKYPGIRSLQGPENDAEDFWEWVKSPNGGRVPSDADHLRYIVSSKFPAVSDDSLCPPTLELVDQAFRPIAKAALQNGHVGERLYIFMAGHGFAPGAAFGPNLDDAALLMANADLNTLGLHIPGGLYAEWFRAAAAFDEVLLFMDCCRDDFGRTPVHFPPFSERTDPGAANVRVLHAYATKWSYSAREKVVNGNGKVRGVFSFAVMEGLRGAAADVNGDVTGASLEAYVYNRLPKLANDNSYQEPRFYYEKQRDIKIVTAPVKRCNVTFSWTNLGNGSVVELIDGLGNLVDTHTINNDVSWMKALPKGLYKIQLQGTERKVLFEIIGEEARNVSLG
jgi:Caspase domain